MFFKKKKPTISVKGEVYSLKMEVVGLKKKIKYDETLRGMIHELDTENVRLKLEVQDLENENKNLKDLSELLSKKFTEEEDENIKLEEENERLREAIRAFLPTAKQDRKETKQ